jgi:hypothetical protein
MRIEPIAIGYVDREDNEGSMNNHDFIYDVDTLPEFYRYHDEHMVHVDEANEQGGEDAEVPLYGEADVDKVIAENDHLQERISRFSKWLVAAFIVYAAVAVLGIWFDTIEELFDGVPMLLVSIAVLRDAWLERK